MIIKEMIFFDLNAQNVLFTLNATEKTLRGYEFKHQQG